MKKIQLFSLCVSLLLIGLPLTACSNRMTESSASESMSSQVIEPPEPEIHESDIKESSSESEAPETEPGQSSQEESESSAAQSSQTSESQETEESSGEEAEQTAFGYEVSDVAALYARDYFGYTYTPITGEKRDQVITLLKQAGQAKPEAIYSRNEGGYFVLLNEGDRFSYALIPVAVRAESDDAYPVSQDVYNTLTAIANEAISAGPSYIQWLVYMKRDRVTAVSFQSDTEAAALEIPAEKIYTAANTLANIKVKVNSGESYTEKKSFAKQPGNIVLKLTFDSGISYSILIENSMIYIESSDMSFGCAYQIETSATSIPKYLNTLM